MATRSAVVILGAGASHDCSPEPDLRNVTLQPPLVRELFDPRFFSPVLRHYPLAQAASTDARSVIARGESIEDYLRSLREASSELRKARYWQMPLYLQHLLWLVGRVDGDGFTRDPGNLQTLVDAFLELDSVLILTLNYDTLVESCLETYGQAPTSMDDYVNPDRPWSLVKLHGSVDWAVEVPYSGPYYSPGIPDVDAVLPHFNDARTAVGDLTRLPIIRRDDPSLDGMRYQDGRLFYPALSAPLGVPDELTCPPNHVEAAGARLDEMESINLLVVGYSGHDAEVMDILRNREKVLRQLTVVDVDPQHSPMAAARDD